MLTRSFSTLFSSSSISERPALLEEAPAFLESLYLCYKKLKDDTDKRNSVLQRSIKTPTRRFAILKYSLLLLNVSSPTPLY